MSLEKTYENKMTEPNMFLKIILRYRLLLGLYYHLSSSKIIRFSARLYCVIFASVTSFSLYTWIISQTENYVAKSYFALITLEINCQVLFSLLTSEYSVLSFSSKAGNIFALDHLSPTSLRCNVTFVLVLISYTMTTISVCIKGYEVQGYSFVVLTRVLPTIQIFSSRLTSLYTMELYKRSIRLLKISVSESFMNKGQSDIEKSAKVKEFLHKYIELSHALNETLYVIKFQVSVKIQ